ncbi:hypothetical protein Catovirus_2_219 [Catovirus CTV1]|uniref:Uncharacterized protein n=1 Tax=Catovirus CTV1 TaxID=1977631 RepID=A0A1V0SC17_9VIRU|nr:hypothetical protein Catovirus_2_219 [Catovirus CTV1]
MDSNILLSILLGFFVALFLFLCTHRFYEYKGPNSAHIKNKIYKLGNECYKLIPTVHICPIK